MAGKFGGYEDEEEDVLAPKEPQVTSQDPKERKAARSLRIKRRQEAIKKAEQPSEETFKEEEPGPIEQATTSAAEELQRLALDGAAKVTNVKVTTDEREVIRRGLFADKMKNSLEKIENEAMEAQIQYDAITSHWDAMLQIKDPLDIDAEIQEQRRKCDLLLDQKNQLIAELKQDLKRMDEAYYEDLDKQDKDIKELSDRIEKQVTIMQRAYEKQLSLIEQAINIEREAMIDHNNKRWEALYKQRDKEEVAHMEYKTEQLEEHKQEIEAIMWDHHAKYREAKIELETLIQELQKELEKLKATCIINTEKIGYNYQVLKKREEENVFVRSQQKRKLNKMSDVANKLRSKIRKAAEDGAIEEIKADAEIVKLMQAMHDLEKKSYHFSHVNNYKFCQVWRMSTDRCMNLTRQLRQAEVALHAHILAEPPPQPPPPPPKSPLVKYEIECATKNAPSTVAGKTGTPKNLNEQEAKDRLVRHILQLVADNTGFLVEDRLLKLIEKYQLTSRNLCTLDSIFMALEIQAEEDIELLCKTFLNYAFCPICVGMEMTSEVLEPSVLGVPSQDGSHHVSISVKTVRGDRTSLRGRSSIARSVSASTSRSVHVGFRGQDLSPADQMLMAEADEIIQKCGAPQARPMISASLPGEALVQLGQLQLSHLYPPPTMTPEFLPPPPRPFPRYAPRRPRDAMPAPPAPAPYTPVPGAYTPFLSHAASYAPYLYARPRAPQPPAYPLRPRPTSGFVPPAPAPHSPTIAAPQPQPPPREDPPLSPERGTPAPYFCRGALIRLEDGSLRRVEEMRTEDFVMSAERTGDLALTQCTLLRLDERGDRLALTLTYDRNRSQVELESTVEHPFFVYGRGWASCKPEHTLARYGLRVQRLQVGDVCVSLVARKHAPPAPGPPAPQPPPAPQAPPAPPQTHPENLSVKEDARKRRWSASDLGEDPPAKKR